MKFRRRIHQRGDQPTLRSELRSPSGVGEGISVRCRRQALARSGWDRARARRRLHPVNRDESLNSYGSSVDDLGAILATAPEVERCFAQRVFEHFVGADQAVDPGFLDDVTADLRGRGADRMHRGIVRVLTSETFKAAERNTSGCYDFAPGTGGANRPPCEVASILRTSCAGCHGANRSEGGLDLTWLEGQVVDGVATPRRAIFERMAERVTTSDLTRQMPPVTDMTLASREALALWLRAQLDAR
jgi:hypothetical protein